MRASSSQAGPVRRLAAALPLLLLLGAHPLRAQEPQEPSAKPAESGGVGGFFNKIGSSVSGLFGGMPDKPVLATLATAPYVKSNEALGADRDVESKRVRAYGLVDAPELLAYLNPLLQKLKDASGIAEVPGRVYLVPSSALDASSTADGNVFVSLGYLRTLAAEDEVVALLAHELAHVLLHHHDSNFFSKIQKQAQAWFAAGSVVKNQLDKLDQAQQGGAVTLNASQNRTLRKMQLAIQLTDGALQPAWGRKQESEADRLAFDLLVKAGYSGAAMNRWLQRIADWEAEQNKTREQQQAEVQASVELLASAGKLDEALNKGVKNAGNTLVEMLGTRHDDANKRLEDMAAYTGKLYPELPRVAIRPGLHLQRPVMAQLLQGYEDTFVAMKLDAEGNPGEALKQLTRLTGKGSPIARHALPNLQMYEVLRKLNREKEGLGYLNRSLQAPEPAWDPFKLMARADKRRGDTQAVFRTGDEAVKRFRDAPALYPELIALYASEGYADKARELAGKCTLTHVDYREECNKSLQAK